MLNWEREGGDVGDGRWVGRGGHHLELGLFKSWMGRGSGRPGQPGRVSCSWRTVSTGTSELEDSKQRGEKIK